MFKFHSKIAKNYNSKELLLNTKYYDLRKYTLFDERTGQKSVKSAHLILH